MNDQLTYKELSNKSKEEVLEMFHTSDEGLDNLEVNNRLEKYGENIASNRKKKTPLFFIIESFKDKFVLILILLAAIDFATDDKLGAMIILGITLISVIIRFTQDYSTYCFNERLKEKIRIFTDVIRENKQKEIRQEKVVCGDIITLSAGSVIPADLYLFESKDLFINQSSFTGESAAIEKLANTRSNSSDPIEISNICLMGCNVISGQGKGIVIKTGINTFIGKMNTKKEVVKEETTFDKGMNHITGLLIRYMVIICILVFMIYGLIRGNLKEAILFSLSVAVGITPSMLPMIVNVNLTKGSKALAKKNTLVKSIKSIQNLGSMDVLCTDKTGTLTKNNIELQKYINVAGEDDEYVLKCAYVNSYLSTGYKNIVDKAIIQYAKTHQVDISEYKKIDEIPFDYMRKRSSIVVENHNNYSVMVKGALEEIVKVCDMALIDNKEVPLNDNIIHKVDLKAEDMSKKGMQVIALAVKHEYNGINKFDIEDEKDLTLIGLIAFLDPPKPSATTTINSLREYGVRVKILTGDNSFATKNICNAVGIDSKILTGKEIENLNDYELSKIVEEVDIFARMNPIQKERVVSTLRKNGHSVGYMGDGVNDAPALRAANIGIAMGSGTDIARETAKMIVMDDNFNSIVNGVLEGRVAYSNIRKITYYLVSCGLAEVLFFCLAILMDMPMPLVAIQLLWLNVVTDGIQDFALSFERPERDIMKEPPRDPKESLFDKELLLEIIVSGTTIGLTVFGLWVYLLKYLGLGTALARVYIVALMIIIQNIHAFNCRSEKRSVFSVPITSNYIFLFGVLGSIVLGIAVLEIDAINIFLKTTFLPYTHLLGLFFLGLIILVVMECYKFIRYHNKRIK